MNRTLFLSIILILKAVVTDAETEVEVLKEGSCRGKEQSRDGAQVTLDYDGYLQDRRGNAGKKFTSTYKLSDPYSFTIGKDEVIPGLEQVTQQMVLMLKSNKCNFKGLVGFCAGSEVILYIPSELAYGEAGAGDTIPPGADLVFEVVIIDVKILETDFERNIRLEAIGRKEEARRREEELENRKNAEIKAKEDYNKLLADEQERRDMHAIRVKEQEEKNRIAELKATETYERQAAQEQKNRDIQAKQVEKQKELVRQELIRREEHQKLIDEELERRVAQQKLVELDLKAREEEAERRRLEQIRREKQEEQVADELVGRDAELRRRVVDQNARQHEQERRDEAEQAILGGSKILTEEEEAIEAARKYFKNRRTRIRQ